MTTMRAEGLVLASAMLMGCNGLVSLGSAYRSAPTSTAGSCEGSGGASVSADGSGGSNPGAGGATSETAPVGTCSVVGIWDGISGIDGTNPSSRASYVFNADGTWIGGTYCADPAATEFMYGTYAVTGGEFDLNTGCGMGPQCPCDFPATYSLTFEPGCARMTLVTVSDVCTGGRLYLSASSEGTELTRRR